MSSRGGLRALGSLGLACAVMLSFAWAQTPPPDDAPTWNDEDKRTLRSLLISNLRRPPYDPSNRVADDPIAQDLGHALFFDKRLSANNEIACSSCHDPRRYFTDGLPVSQGLGKTRRGAPSLVGIGFSSWLYWDGRRDTLWSQAITPIEAPLEMGGSRVDAARLVVSDPVYRPLYDKLFGPLPDLSDSERFVPGSTPYGNQEQAAHWDSMADDDRETVNQVFANLGKAIAAYQRLLRPDASRFDKYVGQVLSRQYSGEPIFNSDEIAGLKLFVSERAQCLRCHNGPLLTNHGFHNIGLPLVNGVVDEGRLPAIDEVLENEFNCLGPYSDARPGLCGELRFVKREGEELRGAFKVPTLRNVAETAPYMHTGQFETLEAVLGHYASPGEGTVGHQELEPSNLTPDEIRQIAAFLRTLTSEIDVEPSRLDEP